jgi:hypothetical protein
MPYLFDALKSLLGITDLVSPGQGIAKPTAVQIATAAAGPQAGFTGRAGLGGEAVEQSDVDLFVGGEMALILDSSWLSYAKYYPAAEELEVGISTPVNCQGLVASNTNAALARRFAESPSKGSIWWSEFFVAGKGCGTGMTRKTHRPIRWL